MNNNLNQGPPQAAPANSEEALAYLAALNSTVGRFQGPERFFTDNISLATPSTVNISRPLNLNRPIEEMIITLKLRATVANNDMTSVWPEAPQTLLQGVLLNGTHRVFGNLTPVRLAGSTIFAYQRLFQNVGNDCLIQPIGGALTRVADPGRPFTSSFTGAVGQYDIVLVYRVPFGPTIGIGQSAKRDLSSFMLQPNDWGDTLQLQLSFGDATALGVPAAAGDVTFTSFGADTGTPTFTIELNYGILGTFANSFQTGVMIRQEQLLTAFTAAGQEQRLMMLQKQITSNVITKSGVAATGLTNGVQAFASLSDVILDATQLRTDNKPIRNNQNNFAMKAYLQGMFNTVIPEGYFVLSFMDAQNPQLAYRGDGLAAGSLYELWSNILTSDSNQRLVVVQEMAYGGPFPPLR